MPSLQPWRRNRLEALIGATETLLDEATSILDEVGADLATGSGQSMESVQVNVAGHERDDAAFNRSVDHCRVSKYKDEVIADG